MSTCSHGRDLSTQVCKYCSCSHGKDTSTCQACQAVVAAGPPKPRITNECVHGVNLLQLCGKCMASGALGPSGSFNVRLPDDLGLSYEERIKRQEELEYRERLAGLDKVPGAIRMFRTWQLHTDDTLRAMVATHTWRKGENIASSMVDGGYSGFFGFSSLAELQRQEAQWWELSQTGQPQTTSEQHSLYSSSFLNISLPMKRWIVSGTFLAYGHMVIAEHGGRSQFAVPEYIVEPDGSDPDFSMRILAVAEKYGMELVSVATARELKVGAVPWWKGKPNA